MLVFLVRRIVFGIAVLIGTSIITFAIGEPSITMRSRSRLPSNSC